LTISPVVASSVNAKRSDRGAGCVLDAAFPGSAIFASSVQYRLNFGDQL
jgi:hypothetical protein